MCARKKISLLLLAFFGNLLLSAVSRPQKEFSASGYVRSYGNMPFVFPGIETSDGKKYLLECDNALKKELLETAGKKICVQGILDDSPSDEKKRLLKDGTIFVIDYDFVY